MYALKRLIAFILATLITVGMLFCVRITNVSKFDDLTGKRTFYIDSASSQALCVDALTIKNALHVRGESIRLSPDELFNFGATTQDLALTLLKKYGGEILFIEKVNNVVSFYAYTPLWQDTVNVAEARVNLHIAISVEEGDQIDAERSAPSACVLGSPIIFGGF